MGTALTNRASDSPLRSPPTTIASTMSGAKSVRRMIRLT